MKPKRQKWEALAAYWDEYGHEAGWDDLFDIKVRADEAGLYVAVAWMEYSSGEIIRTGMSMPHTAYKVNYADLYFVEEKWEMINDSHDTVTAWQWKTARPAEDGDYMEIKEAQR